MDLGTIKSRLENEQYDSLAAAAADMRLIWTNCMSYNQDGSEFYFLADTFGKPVIVPHRFKSLDGELSPNLARKFEEIYAGMRSVEEASGDPERIPTMDERMQLSYDVFKIDNIKMGRVLTIIETACASAINKKASEDEVLLNFDAMSPRCFHEVLT
jgi:hypothetical protein